jgi:hypothetical protein
VVKKKLYVTTAFPVLFCTLLTQSVTPDEENRPKLRPFDSDNLLKIYGSKCDEVMGLRRTLDSEEFHSLRSLADII